MSERDEDTAPEAEAPPLAEEIHRLIGRSRRMLWLASARALEARGDSVFAWQCLCYLVNNGPTVQQDLAMATAQDPAGTSRLLDELESRRLVKRSPDPSDRRRLVVSVTRAGRAWHRSASPAVAEAVGEALQRLTPRQRTTLARLLRTLLDLPAAEPSQAKKVGRRKGC